MDAAHTITIDVKPKAKSRPRFNSLTQRTYTPDSTSDFEDLIRWHYRKQVRQKLTGPVFLSVLFVFKTPKVKKQEFPQRPDVDNLLKAIQDALNGQAYNDDGQIFGLSSFKTYGHKDQIIIKIQQINNPVQAIEKHWVKLC